jgi:glycogen debranching enzyme
MTSTIDFAAGVSATDPVAATSGLRARPGHLFAASGRVALATDALGQIVGEANEGLFVDNTRILQREEILVNDKLILPFSASLAGRERMLAYAQVPQSDGVAKQSLYVEIHRQLADGMDVSLCFHNFGSSMVDATVEVRLAADFADTEETHKGQRQQSAPVETEWDRDAGELKFRYQHPDLDRTSVVRVVDAPDDVRAEDGVLFFPMRIRPREQSTVRLRVELLVGDLPGPQPAIDPASLAQLRRRLLDRAPQLVTTNTGVAQAWETAVADLASLAVGVPSGPATPAAGLPLYQYLFGRDALTTAWQALLAMPDMAADALTANAAHQGQRIDDWYDEEPGKLLHQARSGPVTAVGENPFTGYFGDYATPQDLLILLGQHLAWTGDAKVTRELLGTARAALQWLERFGDLDGDGFLEYQLRSEKGPKNQGWKDSGDAIVDERGEMVENPIATCEIQAYWYIALRQAAFAFLRAGDRAYALQLLGQAKRLRKRFDEAFWMPDDQYYALALGPDKSQIRSISSNPGHLLATGIVPSSKASAVVDRLLSPELFSGWGVRTLSNQHPAYNPFSYHLGSVWPVDSGTFSLGFLRYGRIDAVHRLAEGFFAATKLFAGGRLPEALGGLELSSERAHPGIYPEANEPQGWSASAVVMIVQSLLGLRPVAPAGLLLADPQLPAWLPDLELRGIRVGSAVVDIAAHRRPDGSTELQSRVRDGHLRVLRQPPPQAPLTNPLRRLIAAAEGTFE